MSITKITVGFVAQKFDTKTGKCLEQEFIAGDEVNFEDHMGEAVDPRPELNCPFEMKQPNEIAEELSR